MVDGRVGGGIWGLGLHICTQPITVIVPRPSKLRRSAAPANHGSPSIRVLSAQRSPRASHHLTSPATD